MEAAEELASGPNEQTHIVKGKRTKRVRPQSPVPFFNSSNQDHGEAEDDFNNGGDKYDNFDKISPATTSLTRHRDSTEEEEDMANCLILLAQGQSLESPKPAEEDDNVLNCTKFSSRRFMEAASLGSGKAGFYVYECKTCNRTFPSFQALGGHRTSHKKPKAMAALMAIDNDRKQPLFSSDEDEFQFKNDNRTNPFSPHRGNLCSNNSKPKVHECSICGAEFTSGQALGGHMRRHRATIGTNTTLSLSLMALEPEQQQPRKKKNVLSLDLDLNLPAPEDDQTESKFAFASKQQNQQQHQASLVFSAPALVDCHY